jgi:starch synthase (maltosyl-transferring)
LDAGLDVSLELLEGAELIRSAVEIASGVSREKLDVAAELLEDRHTEVHQRAAIALDPELTRVMALHVDPETLTRYRRNLLIIVDRELASLGAWYEMFPRSQAGEGQHGNFRTAQQQLPRLAELGFDVVYLPPIHPVGQTHRKGRNNSLVAGPGDPGSPWAIGSADGGHTAVEPQLGTIEDFESFVAAAEGHGLEVALDYALQCSPDHPWVKDHPDWFNIRPDGSIMYAENPPKKYEDIYPLNFWCENWEALWEACKEVFLFWVARGVRIFRVDNPHTKPFAFWEWVIGEVQRDNPDVIFLSEAFTRPARMKGLAKLGFTQSYTYFTWRNTLPELRDYLTELTQPDVAQYFRPNLFANTPDILTEYLQKGGRPAFRVRLLLAATLSPNYGIYSGFELCENVPREPGSEEYLNSEKFELKQRDWDAPGSINADIKIINRIRRENLALQRLTNLTFHHSDNDQILFYRKSAPENELLIAINLDSDKAQESTLHIPLGDLGIGDDQPFEVEDLLTGERFRWRGVRNYVRFDPAERVGHVFRIVSP